LHISERIKAEERLLGTFVKTPHHVILEVLAGTGLDFAILDAEHSPYGIAEIDRCVMASKGADLPCLVRVADPSPAAILRILDMGADGFLAPHVLNAYQAERIVQSARYGAGGRGYAATNRAGSYGLTPMKEHLKISEHAAVILQIEDPEGVENIDEIVEVDGITACFHRTRRHCCGIWRGEHGCPHSFERGREGAGRLQAKKASGSDVRGKPWGYEPVV
jgi:2-keto-3-deoxy-L-rhamnonate aldolase RhmA